MSLSQQMKHQWRLWLIALAFFTRIKVKPIANFDPKWLNQASRFYGLVGLLIGGLSAACYWLTSFIFPSSIAIILAMLASILVTGAFHEDGLADTWDGFGGGWTIEQKLTIMKDSRLGTYGAAALIMALFLKFQLLLELSIATPLNAALPNVIGGLIIAHCLSRVVAVSLIFDQHYVRDIDSSKVKPMTEKQSVVELIILLASALIPLALLPIHLAGIMIVGLMTVRWLIVKWYQAQLGGYTGDLLGQAQQMSELVIYSILLAYIINS